MILVKNCDQRISKIRNIMMMLATVKFVVIMNCFAGVAKPGQRRRA